VQHNFFKDTCPCLLNTFECIMQDIFFLWYSFQYKIAITLPLCIYIYIYIYISQDRRPSLIQYKHRVTAHMLSSFFWHTETCRKQLGYLGIAPVQYRQYCSVIGEIRHILVPLLRNTCKTPVMQKILKIKT
jgi:hypothetical protein